MFSSIDRRTLRWLPALAAVLVFQTCHLWGLHVSKDLPLWDESAYLGWGDEFLYDGKVGSITNAPAYHIFYAIVISIGGLLPGFYVMQYTLKLLMTALVFGVALRYSRSTTLALLIGCFFAFSYFHVNSEVLVYYGALAPYLGAILVAHRSPILSLGLSFLAGLGRLEYMAVPALHSCFLLWSWRRSESWPFRFSWTTGLATALVWAFNIFVLTRITVWQFHNRVWFAWSQNYAFFRYLTGRDSGGNPWLDHQFIAERDFPGAKSLADAWAVNSTGVLEHTWFNLWKLPGYLADFAIAQPYAGWALGPLYVLGGLVATALGVLILRRRSIVPDKGIIRSEALDLTLIIGGIITALPGVLVSSKTNYIMSLLPAAIWLIACFHRIACGSEAYARWHARTFLALTLIFAAASFSGTPAYSTRQDHRTVYRDVITFRETLKPLKELRILGVSTASFVNYLGRENRHVFLEPLAISPINRQADDLSLSGLIRAHNPEVLLINSHWRSSASFQEAVANFDFSGWEAYPLRDGQLYLRAGLLLNPEYVQGWHGREEAGSREWRWSSGDATIAFRNGIADREVTLSFRLSSLTSRDIEILLEGRPIEHFFLEGGTSRAVELRIDRLPAGEARLEFKTPQPAARPGNGDSRELAFCIENLVTRAGGFRRQH